MKKLFTLLALMTCFMGANAKPVEVYSIDYSTYQSFPFFVMGFTPTFDGNAMVDNGSGWHQYFIADGIKTEAGCNYLVIALVRAANRAASFNVNMGWGWGDGQSKSCGVAVPQSAEFQKVMWEYSGIGGTSCNLVAQPNFWSGESLEWKSLTVYKIVRNDPDTDSRVMADVMENGDCERDYAPGEIPSMTGRTKGLGDHSTFEEGKGVDGSRAMVVASIDNATETWDSQFFVTTPNHVWKSGEKYKFKMMARADVPAKIHSQIHAMPGAYLGEFFGDVNLTTEWQTYEFEGTVNSTGAQTIAFNLNEDKTLATNFYFDNIEWWAGGAWEGSADFKDGKPVEAIGSEITAGLQVGDLIKVSVYDEWGTFPEMALVSKSGESIYAGETYVNDLYVKFGVTEKMLPLLQANGINVLGSDIRMRKVSLAVNSAPVSFDGACWIGDYTLDGTVGPYVHVPAYEFDGDIDLGYTIDLRFDADALLNNLEVVFGGDKGSVTVTDADRFTVKGKSIKLKIYKDEELNALKAGGLTISGDVAGANLRAIVITPTLGAESFDFNNAKIATSNNESHAGDIVPDNLDGEKFLEITDKYDANGDAGSGAKLTITPTAEDPEIPCRFYMTDAGPQLRLSGDGGKVTLTINGVYFSQLFFNQSNFSKNIKCSVGTFYAEEGLWTNDAKVTEVTFTLPKATAADLSQWWINSIEVDPIYDVVLDKAPAGGDLAEYVNEEMKKYKRAKTLAINLEAGKSYTTKQSIKTNIPVTINGKGAGIDATDLEAPFIVLAVDATSTTPQKNQEVYADAQATDYNLLEKVEIDDVMIKNLKGSIISTNGQDWALVNLNITNSIIQLDNANTTFIRFDQTANNKGAIKNINIQNNTIYNINSTSKAYFIRYANASNAAKAFGINNNTSTYDYNISNNTLINTFKNQNFGNNTVNNSKTAITMKNNIFVDVKNITKFAQGNCAKTLEGNFTWGSVKAEDAVAKTVAEGFTTPTAALDLTKENGGLNLTPTGEAEQAGDPRWVIADGGSGDKEATGIETVKNAQDEGAWYTIQGVRVAQPTKGLYIHNGKKVILK